MAENCVAQVMDNLLNRLKVELGRKNEIFYYD